MQLMKPLSRKRYHLYGVMTKLVQTSTSLALPVKHLQQELSTASDRATVVTANGSHTEGLAFHRYEAFTANKDSRKVTTR